MKGKGNYYRKVEEIKIGRRNKKVIEQDTTTENNEVQATETVRRGKMTSMKCVTEVEGNTKYSKMGKIGKKQKSMGRAGNKDI